MPITVKDFPVSDIRISDIERWSDRQILEFSQQLADRYDDPSTTASVRTEIVAACTKVLTVAQSRIAEVTANPLGGFVA
jgi:hypothetical protein